jgi:hypothetical protein
LKVEVVVDQDAFNQGVFNAKGGRFEHLNRTFDGRLEKSLYRFKDALLQTVS